MAALQSWWPVFPYSPVCSFLWAIWLKAQSVAYMHLYFHLHNHLIYGWTTQITCLIRLCFNSHVSVGSLAALTHSLTHSFNFFFIELFCFGKGVKLAPKPYCPSECCWWEYVFVCTLSLRSRLSFSGRLMCDGRMHSMDIHTQTHSIVLKIFSLFWHFPAASCHSVASQQIIVKIRGKIKILCYGYYSFYYLYSVLKIRFDAGDAILLLPCDWESLMLPPRLCVAWN